MDKDVVELQKKMDDLQKKLKDMQSATGKAWEDMKAQAEAAKDGLEKAFDDATSNLKK